MLITLVRPPRPRPGRSCLGRLAAALVAVAVAVALAASGCGDREDRTNVRPPAPGTPASPAHVQGIYRTIHQGLLQLRGNGGFVMVIPEGPGPTSGSYTLLDGTFTVTTNKCGDQVGEYRLSVAGPQEAGKASLAFTLVADACTDRSRYLTIDPWIYANS